MSGLKRNARELGEQGLSAAAGEVIAGMVSSAIDRYDAQATVDDQLEELKGLVVMIHSAVDAAERVNVHSWWLRRWLWRLRDAAADGDELLCSFRQRRAAEEEEARARQQAAKSTLWNAARRVLWSAKSLLKFAVAGDKDIERLSRTVARLEKVAAGIADFLKLIELEIEMSLPPQRKRRKSKKSSWNGQHHHQNQKYTARRRRRRIVLFIARRYIRRAIHVFRATTAGPPCFQPQDAASRLCAMLDDIRVAVVVSDTPEVQGMQWRRGLQAVADRADCVLQPAAPVAITGGDEARLTTTQGRDDDNDDVRRTIESVEKAAARLGDFIKILRIYDLATDLLKG